MDNNKSKQYTTNQLVELIGVSRQTINKFIKRNNIVSIGKIGKQNAFSEDTYNQLKQHYSSKSKAVKATKKHVSKRKLPAKVTNSGGRGYKYGVPTTLMSVPDDIVQILQAYLDEANPEQRQKFFDSNVKKEIKRILTDKINKL